MSLLTTEQPQRHPNPTVKAQRLAYLIWERPELEQAKSFLLSFGLKCLHETPDELYLRGAAEAPYCYFVRRGRKARFLGFALEVADHGDLEVLAQLPEASAIETLTSPGGGSVVRLHDPSGFLVEAVYGQLAEPALPIRDVLTRNLPGETPRINGTQRVPLSAPDVIKLGHLVLELADFQATCAWYCQHFGFIPSDVQVLPDGSPAVTFMRLDLGDTPADHHTLALAQAFAPQFSHCAFELLDEDALGMGQRVLREQRYKHAWGIGRHILGSQVFDYWNDPWGFRHEHYCDGDVFTADMPMGEHFIRQDSMAQWGAPMPASFTRPKLSLSNLVGLVRGLRHSPDVTVSKLLTLARLFA